MADDDIQAQRDALAMVVVNVWRQLQDNYNIDSLDAEEWMTTAGLLHEAPATEEQAQRYDCEVGDPVNALTALGKAALFLTEETK
jgi:hypothetical protein